MHHHKLENKTVKQCAAQLAKEVMVLWEKARIPARRSVHAIEKAKKLFQELAGLKKTAKTRKNAVKLVEKE